MQVDFTLEDAAVDSEEALRHRVRTEYLRPFNLESGPVMRVYLYRQAPDNHVLLINIHHIACDGVSTWLLLQELRELYAAETEGRKHELPHLSATYEDFVTTQKQLLEGPKGETLWQFWKKQLYGPLPTLDLGTDKVRPAVQSFNGAAAPVSLDAALTQKLRALAQAEGVTLFALLASAFQTMLYRLTGQDDILVGTPTTGREQRAFQSIMGYFVNPVVLRARFADNPSFRTFLQRHKTVILGAIAHQDFPFPYLVEKLQLPRDKSRSPLFQVFFSLLKAQGDDAVQEVIAGGTQHPEGHEWGKLRILGYDMEQQEGQFDLTLALTESLGTVHGKLKYNTDLFEHATAERFAGHFVTLLENILTEPDRPVSQLQLLTAETRRWLVDDLNRTAAPFPAEACMHHLFEAQADAHPDQIALHMPALAEKGLPSQFTYKTLEEKANQLAHHLRLLGVAPESKVGIAMHRSPDMIVAMLGILKAGGAYVPLDPEYPSERLAYIAEDAGLQAVVTHEGGAAHLPEGAVPLVFLDRDGPEIARHPTSRPEGGATASNLAYIIYTSGSTGKPKGVLIEHRGVVNKLTHFKKDVVFDHTHRFTLIASFAFDASIGQIFLPLVKGCPLYLMPRDRQNDPEYFWDFIAENGINVLYTTASFLSPMLDSARDLRALHICYVFLGAESFPLPLLHKIREKLNPPTVVNMYGPTETTVNCIMHTVEGDPKGQVPLGHPLPNYTAYLLDKNLQIVPVGVTAEIHIGGPAVARGYHNQPENTADRFIPDPFSPVPGARLYRSGDLGKYLPDGKIVFMGRADKQIKVNGYRIEPGEVEAAILRHAHIKDALVLAREDNAGNNRLVAYLIPTAGAEVPAIQKMRAFLQDKLPTYMVPTAFVGLGQFPITPTGKVDINALPAPGVRPDSGAAYAAPQTEVQRLLARVWAEVLGLERVGLHDNFFDLGGASVQSIQVVNKANELGFQLNAGMLFEFQVLEQLATAAEASYHPDRATAPTMPTVVPPPAEERPPAGTMRPSFAGDRASVIVESIGAYLPDKVVSTQEILQGCTANVRFPIEKMTGIQTRRMAGEEEFAIDMAIRAAEDALSRSKFRPEEIELLICCNISRYDGPTKVSYEPSTSMKLRKHFGMKHAIGFDLSNACATMWTAVNIIDAFIANGTIRCGMAVSGEYITHITRTAMQELSDNFLDPRMACLTVGDSGAAVILERNTNPEVGFHSLHMFTESELCRNCIAHFTDQVHGGAIMYVESVKAAASAIQPGARLVLDAILRQNWLPEVRFDHLLMHQTSSTTISDARREINSLYQHIIATPENTIDNIAHRGNTATTSHWVAIVDKVRQGQMQSGDRVVFGISGSGHTLGAALYTFDDLPDRILHNRPNQRPANGQQAPALPATRWKAPVPRVSIAGLGLHAPEGAPADALEMAKRAAAACIRQSGYHKPEIGLVIHTGNYRNKFLSEPAVAALVAGDLGINPHPDSESHNKSFAFDLLNGAGGFLEACYTAIQMMQAGKYNTALVTASEIENNLDFRPGMLLGIQETGSAMMLHHDPSGQSGFGNFYMKGFPAYLDTLDIYMTWKGRESFLNFIRNPNLESYYAACLREATRAFLQAEGLTLADIHWIVPPQISASWIMELGSELGTDASRMVVVPDTGGDLYTSSLPYALNHLMQTQQPAPGQRALLLSVSSGIQVGCALYHF
jgi:amino acid adenylation domain-containing protein